MGGNGRGEARGARDTSSAPAGHLPLEGKAWGFRACGRGGRIATASLRTGRGNDRIRAVAQRRLRAGRALKALAALRRRRRPPYRERLVVTFFYKPIDIVGFMCYHALTYKKDMLKE